MADLVKSASGGFIALEILLKPPANGGGSSPWVVAFLYFRTVIMSVSIEPSALSLTPLPQPRKRFCCRAGGSSQCLLLSVASTNHQQRNGEFDKLQIYSKKNKKSPTHGTPCIPFFWVSFIVPWFTWGRRRSILVGSECAARLIFVLPDTPKDYELAPGAVGTWMAPWFSNG